MRNVYKDEVCINKQLDAKRVFDSDKSNTFVYRTEFLHCSKRHASKSHTSNYKKN